MAIRLTNHSREMAVLALLDATFSKKEARAKKKLSDAAHRAIKKKLGAKYKLLLDLPKGWASTSAHERFNVGGQSRWVSFETIPVPAQISLDFLAFDAKDPLGIAIIEAHDAVLALAEQRKELKRKAEGICARFSTAEKLATEWPMIAPHLPKESAPVPALPIAEVTEAFRKAAA
jgi:hypothetical protein